VDSIRHFKSGGGWITWLQQTVLILMALVLFIPAAPVQADIGPKPTETFTFEFKIPRVDIVSGQLFECEVSDCQDARQLVTGTMQHFTCQVDMCSAMASRTYKKYQKLVITFSDGVRISNIFTVNPFDSSFTVTVLQDSLQVSVAPDALSRACCPSLGLTLVLETLLASLYLSTFHLPRSILGWVPIASLITLPFVWAVFPYLGLNTWLATGLSETFAVAVEAVFIYVITSRAIPLRHVIALSLAMNAFSFLVGLATAF
jgi:hypothetical protein